MADFTPIMTVVAAALRDTHGRVLLQQRPAGKTLAGLWEFPGGKVEAGETPEAALVRELAEELAIDVAEDALMPVTFASVAVGNRHLLLLLYLCTAWRGEPRAVEAPALRWLLPAEMDAAEMPPADAPFIDALARLA